MAGWEVAVAIIGLPFGLVLFIIPVLVLIGLVVCGLRGFIALKLRQWKSKPATPEEIMEVLKEWSEREQR